MYNVHIIDKYTIFVSLFVLGIKFVCVGVEFLAFNVLKPTKGYCYKRYTVH